MVKMADYIERSVTRLDEVAARGLELVEPLVERFVLSGCDALRIVASGSSKNAADIARPLLQRSLGREVQVVTPEAFIDFEHAQPTNTFNVAVSQSGYSTNTIAALDFMAEHYLPCAALTANWAAPISEHAVCVFDYGVGVESVDFVTMGVHVLVCYLMLFGIEAGERMGALDAAEADRLRECLHVAGKACASGISAARALFENQKLALSTQAPAIFVGNAALRGVAQEAALKFSETTKVPAMWFEGEEFIHGPEMQITPGYLVVIIDDAGGSERLAGIARGIRSVTDTCYLITAHPEGVAHEVAIEASAPEVYPFAALAFIQYLAAQIADALKSWDVHPYLDAVDDAFASKAPGYDESVHELERRAATVYGDSAGA